MSPAAIAVGLILHFMSDALATAFSAAFDFHAQRRATSWFLGSIEMTNVGVEVNGRSSFRGLEIASLISVALLLGCGGGSGDQFPTAKVSGKVTVGGQPVTGGELIFSPIAAADTKGPKGAGKNGVGVVKSDGTYTVSTYGSGDGAVVAKHNVVFVPAAVTTPAAPAGGHAATAPSPYMGMKPSPSEVTVSKGENKIDIELVK